MVFKLLAREPTLIPLFVAVGVGVAGAGAFGAHYLSNSSDVVIRKRQNATPWESVTQGQNTKLWSANRDWWKERASIPDPRSLYMTEGGASVSSALKDAKAKAKAKLEGEPQ